MGCINYTPTLVHVHIATEVLSILLCFIVKGLVGDIDSIIGNMLDLCFYRSEGILPME